MQYKPKYSSLYWTWFPYKQTTERLDYWCMGSRVKNLFLTTNNSSTIPLSWKKDDNILLERNYCSPNGEEMCLLPTGQGVHLEVYMGKT
jgi:hypothetical protein